MAMYYENGLWLGLFRDDFREEDLKVEEKQNPTECKYCGCKEIRTETDSAIHFRCFSSYWHDGDEWNISNNCAAVCAVQLVELRERVQRADQDIEFTKAREANFVTALRSRLRTLNERVQRAVKVLEGGDRIMMMLDDDDEDVSFVVPATDVDRAVGILEGEEDGQVE